MKLELKKSSIVWFGLSFGLISKNIIWFDLDNFFSIDLGKLWFRLFIGTKHFYFCRYLGWIL